MLRPGDRVFINGSGEEGVVKQVQTNAVIVHVQVAGGHDERRYSHESLRFVPLTREPSFVYAY